MGEASLTGSFISNAKASFFPAFFFGAYIKNISFIKKPWNNLSQDNVGYEVRVHFCTEQKFRKYSDEL